MAMINEIGVYFSTLGSGIGIWFEIAIFAGTFVVALILKQYTESYKLRQALKKKGLADESVPHTQVPRPKVTKVDEPPGLDTTYTRTTTRSPPGSRSKRGSLESKDSVRVFDDICAAKNPAASLETYEQMKASGMDKKLPEFAKSSRNTVQDFYNGLVQCAIRQGKPGLVDSLIADMRIKNASRTREFYESAMKMLAGKRFYREALQVYAQMQVDGIDPSPVTYSCLVNFAVEVGEVDLAVTFFEKLSTLQTPSIRAYMTILRAFSKRQDTSNSIKILKDMQTRNIELDSLVVNIVLGTLVNAGELDQAETLIHDMLSNDKPTVDVVSYNTLIKGYAQKGEMTKALSCLEKMSASGLKPNIITFNTAMDSAVRCKKPGEAWRLLNHMRTAALVPDKYTCSILVKGLHDDATTERVQECLALLHGLVQDAGKAELAQLCEVLFVSLLEASVKTKDSKLMLDVYQQVKLAGITSQAFNGLVRALAAEGELDHCLRVWEDMTNAGVSPHMSSCEALVQAIKDNDQNGKRPSLSECIQKSSNPGTVRTLVYALCKGRRTDLAIGIYKTTKAQHSQINLDLATCVALISAQCESSVKEAIKMLEDMKASGFRPDETVLNTLLSACFKEADVNMGIKVFS
jgi:pentatricopeptide repeat protein